MCLGEENEKLKVKKRLKKMVASGDNNSSSFFTFNFPINAPLDFLGAFML